VFVPTVPGRYLTSVSSNIVKLDFRTTQVVPLFVPQASTLIQRILSFFTGRRAEFVDPRIVSMAQGREGSSPISLLLGVYSFSHKSNHARLSKHFI
jgi:hypothetical protein